METRIKPIRAMRSQRNKNIQPFIRQHADEIIAYFIEVEDKFSLLTVFNEGKRLFFKKIKTTASLDHLLANSALISWFSQKLNEWSPIFDQAHIDGIRADIRDYLFLPVLEQEKFNIWLQSVIEKNKKEWQLFFVEANDIQSPEWSAYVNHYFPNNPADTPPSDLKACLTDYLAGSFYYALQAAWHGQQVVNPELKIKTNLLAKMLNNCDTPGFILAKFGFDLQMDIRREINGLLVRIKDKDIEKSEISLEIDAIKIVVRNKPLFQGLAHFAERLLEDEINLLHKQLQSSTETKRGFFRAMREMLSSSKLVKRKFSDSTLHPSPRSPRPPEFTSEPPPSELPAKLSDRDLTTLKPGERLRAMRKTPELRSMESTMFQPDVRESDQSKEDDEKEHDEKQKSPRF